MVEFDVHNLQKIKLGVHIAQGALVLIAWCLEIAVFHDAKSIDGRAGWYFGLVSAALLFTSYHPLSLHQRSVQHANDKCFQ